MWGLDDYQFLPFIWGSSQLNGHTSITPNSIHNQAVLEANAEDYLYLGCIKFVKHVSNATASMPVCPPQHDCPYPCLAALQVVEDAAAAASIAAFYTVYASAV